MEPHIVEDIAFVAKTYGWILKRHKPEFTELMFCKQDDEETHITVWYGKMTVRTTLVHPKNGKTQLHRKQVNMELLERIFENPRLHTGKGYHRKYKVNINKWK